MHFSTLFLLPALVAATPISTLPNNPQDAYPDPTQVHIQGVKYGGTGCPQGTVASAISGDRTTMTLIYDAYVASIGPGVAVTEKRKNCQLNVDLYYPGGFQFSIFSADYRGYAALDKSVTGTQRSTYYFSGQTNQAATQTDFKGPYEGNYLIHDEADNASIVWSPCGAEGLLNINSQVSLTSTNTSSTGIMTSDSEDLKFTQILYVKWQKC